MNQNMQFQGKNEQSISRDLKESALLLMTSVSEKFLVNPYNIRVYE
jgi:hypothetical protein